MSNNSNRVVLPAKNNVYPTEVKHIKPTLNHNEADLQGPAFFFLFSNCNKNGPVPLCQGRKQPNKDDRDMNNTEYAEVGREMTLDDLTPFFSLAIDGPDPSKPIYLNDYNYAKTISYLFQVPLPKLNTNVYPRRCRFTGDDVEKIQRQVTGVDMKCLAQGEIPLGTFLLLTNSPRFPYTLHVNRVHWNSSVYVYYDFTLKRNIVVKEI